MSVFVENVPRMPPLSTAAIERIGEQVLAELCPTALERPLALDVLDLVEVVLPRYGIHFTPASIIEMGDRLGATDPSGDREIEILLVESIWDELLLGGRRANRARATVLHELGHALIHVPVMRRRMRSELGKALLNRVERSKLPAFEEPEWQAWALAGCIAAPRRTIEMTNARTVDELAEIYGISASMMASHLRRLRLIGRFA